jgi:hypothetical protein
MQSAAHRQPNIVTQVIALREERSSEPTSVRTTPDRRRDRQPRVRWREYPTVPTTLSTRLRLLGPETDDRYASGGEWAFGRTRRRIFTQAAAVTI